MKKLSISILALMSILNHAQTLITDTTKVKQIEEVEIVSTRRPSKISDIAGTVWVMKKSDIIQQAQSGVPFKEMLAQFVPGIDVGSQGRTNFGQNMRGRSILVMIDGVSINSLRGVSRELEAIDPFNIEKIEVLSGASSLYGGNATGGIINIITKKPVKKGISAETNLTYISGFMGKKDGDYKIAQSVATKGERFFARIGVAFQQNGAFIGADRKQILSDISQTDLQYNRSIDILGTLGYKFNPKNEITVGLQFFDSRFTGDRSLSIGKDYGALLKANPSLFKMQDGFTSDKKIGSTRYMANLAYKLNGILGGQDLFFQASTRAEKFGFYPFPGLMKLGPKSTVLNSASEQNTNLTSIKAVLTKNWNTFNLNYGADADFEGFKAYRNVFDMAKSLESGGMINKTVFTLGRYPTFHSTTLAGFAQAQYKINQKIELGGGIRYQNMSVKIDDFIGTNEQVQLAYGIGKSATPISGGTSSYNIALGNAHLLYKPDRSNQMWLNFSQGAALADPAKLYGVGSYTFNKNTQNWDLKSSVNIKDQKLQGIVTNQYEIGYRFKNSNFNAQFSGFYSKSDKTIEVKNISNNLVISVNDLSLRNMGIEGNANARLDNGFIFGFGMLYIKSDVEKDGNWHQQDIFIASPSKMTSYIGYQKNNWDLRFQNLQTFNLKDDSGSMINGYNTSDLMLGYGTHFGKFNFSIQNLFNTDYQTIWSVRAQKLYGSSLKLPDLFYYKGRGRTFAFTYSLTL